MTIVWAEDAPEDWEAFQAEAIRCSKDNMSEVIGVREQEPNTVLVNTVRYMAASFTDYGGEEAISNFQWFHRII